MRWLIIPIAYAADPIDAFVKKVAEVLINPFIVLLFTVALVWFLYGVFKFLSNSGNDEERSTGKRHILWGIIGMFIMMSVFTIMQIIVRTIGSDVVVQN